MVKMKTLRNIFFDEITTRLQTRLDDETRETITGKQWKPIYYMIQVKLDVATMDNTRIIRRQLLNDLEDEIT